MLGERIYRALADYETDQAAKITGMLLEIDNNELLNLLGNKRELTNKAAAAAEILTGSGTVAVSRPKKRWVPVATQSS